MRGSSTFVLALTLGSSALAGPPRFRVTDIGSLVGLSTIPTALNDRGEVAGYSLVGPAGTHSGPPAHAFVYVDGLMTDLFLGAIGIFSQATAINEAGQVVGFHREHPTSFSRPFQYSPGAGVAILNPFGANPIAATGAASGINESGEIVGSAATMSFQQHAFLLLPSDTTATDLTQTLMPPYFASAAAAINDSRQIVGTLTKPGVSPLLDTTDSFFRDDDLSVLLLDELLQSSYPNASFEPKAINADGDVAGYAYGSTQPPHAFVYVNGAFEDLGTLGGDSSWGYGIDSAGNVVGASTLPDDPAWRAFLWTDGVMHDVNDLVPPGLGIVLAQGVAINDLGQIAALGYSASESWPPQKWRSYLLTPKTAVEELTELIELIQGMGLPHGIENSLLAKLGNALAALEAGDVAEACDLLGAFIHEVEAQSGKKIPVDDAAAAIDAAASLRSQLGCI